MTTISLVTPIKYSQIENLRFTEYLFLYLDEGNRVKRAVPDFSESFMDYYQSLILEAIKADKVAPFKLIDRRKTTRESSPMFYIHTNDNGEISSYEAFGDNVTKLENFLLDSKRRETVSKLLKKTR